MLRAMALQIYNVNPFFENQFLIDNAFKEYFRRDGISILFKKYYILFYYKVRVQASYETHITAVSITPVDVTDLPFPDN